MIDKLVDESSNKTFLLREIRDRLQVLKPHIDIVNITLHFFLKDVRPMLPLVMKHSTSVA